MSFSNENPQAGNLANLSPGQCLNLLIEQRHKWILPTIACGALAVVYALFMARYWEASQGLMVRPEVSGPSTSGIGKFADLYQMRTFQETILEIAKSPQVIVAALKAVDEDGSGQLAEEPDAEAIETMRKRLSLLPPGGAEFGKTEVCYLQVKDTDRERALKLVAEFGRQIDKRMHSLRTEKSRSLRNELQQQVLLATEALESGTSQLAKFEKNVGADLGELRMLNASFSGQSDLRQQAVRLNDERRAAELSTREAAHLLEVLQAACKDPEQLIAMPTSLLVSQPTLRRLKDGLVDSQLRAARLEGTRTADHPQVQAALASVEFIREDLHQELEVAIRGLEVEIKLGKHRAAKLDKQYTSVQDRLSRLAELRAGYANHMSTVHNSRQVLDQAQKQLGQVNAQLAAANTSSLVTPIDQPETGPNPAGPGRAIVVLVGAFAGFALGIGWLFLTISPPLAIQPATSVSQTEEVALETTNQAVTQETLSPAPVITPVPKNIPSSLPPTIAAKIAEIVKTREAVVASETCI